MDSEISINNSKIEDTGSSVTIMSVEQMLKQGQREALEGRKHLVTHGPGQFFIRTVISHNQPYRQVVRHIRRGGKRVIEVARLSWPSEDRNNGEKATNNLGKWVG